jgi:hypothetical protein
MVCSVIDGVLRGVAVLASAIIALSFVLFAVEEVRDASKRQQSAAVDPGGAAERRRAATHTKAREVVDDANDVLLRPFAGVIDSENPWAARGVPALIGLLLYGLGLAYLARRVDVRAHTIVRHAPPKPPAPAGSKPPPTL